MNFTDTTFQSHGLSPICEALLNISSFHTATENRISSLIHFLSEKGVTSVGTRFVALCVLVGNSAAETEASQSAEPSWTKFESEIPPGTGEAIKRVTASAARCAAQPTEGGEALIVGSLLAALRWW
jgi:hypothetical protein